MEGLDYDKLYKCCEWFFGLPYEKKKNIIKSAWNPENSNLYRGYFPVIDENPSRKEGFEFARDIDPSVAPDNWFYEQSVWPDEDGSFPFKEFLTGCTRTLSYTMSFVDFICTRTLSYSMSVVGFHLH